MMELTKERLQEIAEDGFLKHGEAKAMARQMLAGMEQEPVGITDRSEIQGLKRGEMANVMPPDFKGVDAGDEVLLYAAPQLPQPAVPFGFTDGDAHGMVYEPRHADRLANPMPVYRLPPQPAVVPHPVSAVKGELAFIGHFERIIGERDGDIDIGQLGRGNYDALMLAALDAFRATMLQAGNSPVIPDAWIPVSERMPPNKPGSYEYIVFESLNNRAHHDYWNVPDGSCDDFPPFWNHYGKYVTHWMLLPAAPQQEVK